MHSKQVILSRRCLDISKKIIVHKFFFINITIKWIKASNVNKNTIFERENKHKEL